MRIAGWLLLVLGVLLAAFSALRVGGAMACARQEGVDVAARCEPAGYWLGAGVIGVALALAGVAFLVARRRRGRIA